MTIRVAAGDASGWTQLSRIWIEERNAGKGRFYEIETSRSYRDRLVLKLLGIDDPNAAEALRGFRVHAAASDVGELGEHEFHRSEMVGMRVVEADGTLLGEVEDLIPTGGVELLQVRSSLGEETLVPLAREFLLEVDQEGRSIRVRLPDGLRGLNRGKDEVG